MSMLCNILPYYGYLHKWRILLERISKNTKDIWEQNKAGLIYCGRDCKINYNITEKDHIDALSGIRIAERSWWDLFLISISDSLPNTWWNIITAIIDQLNEDEVVILDYHDNIFQKFQIQYQLKEDISNILPAVLCPSFKKESKLFANPEKNKIMEFIINESRTKSVVIEKNSEDISIYSVFSQILKSTWINDFDEIIVNITERTKHWKFPDWECRIKKIRLLAKNLNEKDNALDIIDQVSDVKDVKMWLSINNANSIEREPFGDLFPKYKVIFNPKAKRSNEEPTDVIFSGNTLKLHWK